MLGIWLSVAVLREDLNAVGEGKKGSVDIASLQLPLRNLFALGFVIQGEGGPFASSQINNEDLRSDGLCFIFIFQNLLLLNVQLENSVGSGGKPIIFGLSSDPPLISSLNQLPYLIINKYLNLPLPRSRPCVW